MKDETMQALLDAFVQAPNEEARREAYEALQEYSKTVESPLVTIVERT